jgi:hypothetical protein
LFTDLPHTVTHARTYTLTNTNAHVYTYACANTNVNSAAGWWRRHCNAHAYTDACASNLHAKHAGEREWRYHSWDGCT